MESVDVLLSLGVKALVIACNTATATCINEVRAYSPVPVISVEPAIKPACALPGDGLVLALATAATTRLERYQSLRSRMPDPSRVVSVACPGLVERIERGITAEGAFDDLLDSYTSFLHNKKIDAIVLGCTHYVFIKKAIAAYAASHFMGECRLFDGNEATIRQLGRVLRERDMLSPRQGKGSVEFRTSGNEARLRPIFLSLLA